ncbi:MAG: hypothetical protein D6731_17370 [Planctomycetota bacterium]|nr:MAG: hypothetical protein D6731_17370 [Planctomycetota bacterium]
MTYPVYLTVLRVYTDPPFRHTGVHLRGAVLAHYPDRAVFHNHLDRPQVPRVRYLSHQGVACLVGFAEGSGPLLEVYRDLEEIRTPHQVYAVVETELEKIELRVGVDGTRHRYRTATPWLALNQDNYGRYRAAPDDVGRHELLGGIFVGNALSALKALGIRLTPQERIEADVALLRERKVTLGSTTLLGLEVDVVTNLRWSPWLGLGKQVAKGFGRFLPREEPTAWS